MTEIAEVSARERDEWCLHYKSLADGGTPSLNIYQVTLKDLAMTSFANAYYTVIQRHDSLRTVFPLSKGEIMRRIHPFSTDLFGLKYFDLSTVHNRGKSFIGICEREAQVLYRLDLGPLIVGLMFNMGGDRYVFKAYIHHIISDALSLQVFEREIFSVYERFRTNQKPDLLPITCQLHQYVAKINRRVAKDMPRQSRYWNSKFERHGRMINLQSFYDEFSRIYGNSTLEHSLGKDWSEGGIQLALRPRRWNIYVTQVGAPLLNKLRNIAREMGVSLFGLLLGALFVTIHITHLINDIWISTPVSNRNDPEHRNIIGNLLGGVFLYNNVHLEMFLEKAIINAYEEYIRSARFVILDFSGFLSYTLPWKCSLFVNLVTCGRALPKLANLIERHVQSPGGFYILSNSMFEYQDALVFNWEYHRDFYNSDMVTHLSMVYQRVLLQVVTDRRIQLSNLKEASVGARGLGR